MTYSLFGAVLFAVALLVVVFFAKRINRTSDASGPWPFHQKKPLSPVEQVLYFRLIKALPECIVLAQVPLSRFLGVNKGSNGWTWMNRINRMSVDYLICLKDATIVAAIELDDKSHEKPDRIAADGKKNNVLAAAGIALVRWQARELPTETEIRFRFTAET